MAYTEEQIIELAAVKVQDIVLQKVQEFTDGVEGEVQKLRLQYAESMQFNSAMQRAVNGMATDLALLEPMKTKVIELHTLFCKNGYMQKFNALHDLVHLFFRDRFKTCPVAQQVRDISVYLDEQKTEAVRRAEGKMRTRKQDARWTVSTTIAVIVAVVAVATLATKLLGWW